MKTLAINSTAQVEHYIERYTVWRDHRNFYSNESVGYCLVNDTQGLPCFYHWDVENINRCASDTIVIDALTESIHLESEFRQYNPFKRYIIFTGGSWDKNQVDLGYEYEVIYHAWVLFEMADTYTNPSKFTYMLDKIYNFDYPKPYVFFSTTGNIRDTRTYLIDELQRTLSYNDYIFKYCGRDIGVKGHNLDSVDITPGKFDPYTPLLEKYYYHVSQVLPMKLYNSSYFNMVIETNNNIEDSFFLTEKTLKSLITGCPFVVLSASNFLSNLHKLGFETYGSLWDESYDEETNFFKRIKKIARLVDDLKQFNWAKHRDQLEYIALKNRSNFLNLNKILDKEYYNLEQQIKNITL